MNLDDDIVVTIDEEEDEVAGVEAGKAKPGEEGADPNKAKTGEEGIEDLLKKLKDVSAREESEKLARRQAERRATDSETVARRATEELVVTKTAVVDAEYNAVENALVAVQAEGDSAGKELEAAFEAGDAKKIVEAQRKLARSEARAVELESGKAALEARRKERAEPGDRVETRRTERREERPADRPDPVEDYIGQFHPRSQAWLREHRECVTDDKLNKKVLAAHNMAESEGIAANTDDYFAYIDDFMGFNVGEPEKKGPSKASVPSVPARRAAPSAPVSRNNGGGSGSELKPGEVQLTAREAARATDGTLVWNIGPNKGKPIGTKEFARRKVQMGKEGYFDPANYGT